MADEMIHFYDQDSRPPPPTYQHHLDTEKPIHHNPLVRVHEEKEVPQPVVTRRELWGWYGYGFASEPFSVVAMSVFIPIILQTLARTAGTNLAKTQPCNVKTEEGCVVRLGSLWIDTASFPLYVTSISVAVQALVFVSMGALADHGNWRKVFMLFWAVVGSIATILFLTVTTPKLFWLAALYTIIANAAFGASYVFYYAYIPTLTRYHPDVVAAQEEKKGYDELMSVMERVGNGISSHGMAFGYGAGVFLLIICAVIVYLLGQQTVYPMQIGCALAGFWWLVFSWIPYKFLAPRPGPPLPAGENYLIYSWKQTFKTVASVRQLSQAFRFLLAWFLLSDGISTMVSVAVIFGQSKLKMPEIQLILAAIVVPIAALIGTYAWLWLQRRFNMTTRQMVILLTALFSVLPLYGLLGFVAPFGLRTIPEVWLVCIYHGFMLGAIQSFCRVLFAELLPAGKENEFFSLYEITDKGSAWIGPLVTGAISDVTHELRHSFWFLFVMIAIPIFLIWSMDVRKGKEEARQFLERERSRSML